MNIILQHPKCHEWYIATMRKTGSSLWGVRGKILNPDGSLREYGSEVYFASREVAEKACRSRAKKKEKIRKMARKEISDLPECAYEHIEPDADNL